MSQYRQEQIEAHPGWSKEIKALVSRGMIRQGMTRAQVQASWGRPLDINRSVGSWGTREQWVYGDARYTDPKYVYFRNGRCTGWQQ
jgi:hypothetical protein